MRDAPGSNGSGRAFPEPEAGEYQKAPSMPRWSRLALASAATALICIHASVAPANSVPAAAIGYLCLTLTLLGCALAFYGRSRLAHGRLRIRWWLISAGALTASLGYAPSFTQGIFHTAVARPLQTICFNTSEALYLLAAILFFAGVARSIVILDMLQALLFAVLRFNLIYSSATRDHFTVNHLLIGQVVALFLFLVATVACLGASSRAELQFLRILSWFFGLRLISFFLSNQVCYVWLHYQNCSRWDVPGPALLAVFALVLLHTAHPARDAARDQASLPRRSLAVRSLMPSFLALLNLMLALFLLPVSIPLAAAAISVSLVGYVARTALLHAQALEEKAVLQIRNEHLEGLAVRDPLTGIGNRRSLAAAYHRLQATSGDTPLSLLVTDIDSFKQANDCHGHHHGDKVLVALARKLESLAAGIPGSHCARLGGDEFALLLPNVAPQEARTLAEKLRFLFSAHAFEVENSRVSVSVGVACLAEAHYLPLETLASCADEALYRAKVLGRNRVEVQPILQSRIATEDPAPALRLELQHTSG